MYDGNTGRQISILFLTHNKLDKVIACFESLKYTLERPDVYEWIILDNNSEMPTKQYLLMFANKHNGVNLILEDENLGVASGRHKMMKLTQGNTILSLDSDVKDRKGIFIDRLAERLDDPAVGIVGVHGGYFRPDWRWGPYDLRNPVIIPDWVSGYCQMFDRDVLDRGVEIDVNYTPYWLEDADFCFQIRYNLGLEPAFVRGLGLVHNWGKTNHGTKASKYAKWDYFKGKWRAKHDAWRRGQKHGTGSKK